VGSEEGGGGVQRHFWERMGCRGGMRALEAVVAMFGRLHLGEEGSRAGPTQQ
jgi:hypothetical protein